MNSVNNLVKNIPVDLICGDIFEANELYYILCECGPGQYCCLSFSNGGRWTDMNSNKHLAVEGLRFVGRDLNIIVEQKQ